LSLQIAGAVALAALFGTSAFAESRPHQRTESSGGRIERGGGSRSTGSVEARGRSVAPSQQPRSEDRSAMRNNTQRESRSRDLGTWRNDSSSTTQRDSQRYDNNRGSNRNDTRGSYDNRNGNRSDNRGDNNRYDNRGNNRNDNNRYDNRGNNRNDNNRYDNRNNSRNDNRRYDNRSRGSRNDWRPGSNPYRGQHYGGYGRVSRYERYRDGYRVWIGGGLYPIFVPFSYWSRNPLRIGVSIRFGGYWDPLGYWSVYDYSPYDGYGRYDNVYTSGEIRGTVESVDYRRGTLVLNDDLSRQFVTVTLPRDRRADSLRPGDYVEFSGDWSRSGYFNAYRLDRVD
jgi:hypothetical protein